MSWERRGSRADSEGGQQPPPAAPEAKRGGGPPEPPPPLPFCALDARFTAAVKESDLDTSTLTLLHQVSHVATVAFQTADAEPKLTDWTSTGGAYFLYDSGVIQRYHDTQGKRNFAHGKKGARGLPIAVIKNEDEEPYAINNPKATGKAADEEAEKRMQEAAAAAAAAAEAASVGTSVADEARAPAAGGKKRRRRRRSLRRAAAAASAESSGGGDGGAVGPGSSNSSSGGGLTIQQYIRKGIMPGEGAAREVAAYLLDHGHVAGVPPTALALARHPSFYVSKRYRAAVDTARATHEAALAAAEAALHTEAVDTAMKILSAEQQEAAAAAAAAAAAGGGTVAGGSDSETAPPASSVTATPAGTKSRSSRRRKGTSIDLGGSDSGPGSPALQGAASTGSVPAIATAAASGARPAPIAMSSDRRRGSCVLAGAASPQSGPVAVTSAAGAATASLTTYSVSTAPVSSSAVPPAASGGSATTNVPPLSPRAHLSSAANRTVPSTPSLGSASNPVAAPAPAPALASSSGAGVEGAAASLVSLELPPIKAGSLQIFVPHICTAEEMASTLWPVEEVQKLAILDIRLCNTDRNDDNILIRAYFDGDSELAEIEALERAEAEKEEEQHRAASVPAPAAVAEPAAPRTGLGLHTSSSGSLAARAPPPPPPTSSVGRVPTIIRYWQKLLRPVVQPDTLCKCDSAPGGCLVAAHVMRNAERRRRFERLRQLMALSSSVLTSPALTGLNVGAVETASLSGSSGEGAVGKEGGPLSARAASPLTGTGGASKHHIALVSAAAALVSSLPTSAVMDTDGYPLLAAAAALSLGMGMGPGVGGSDAADIDGDSPSKEGGRPRYVPATASAARANITAAFSGIEGLSFDDSDVEALLALQDDDGCGWADLSGATPWHGGMTAAGRSPSPLPGSAGRSASSSAVASPALGPSSFLAALIGKPAGVVAPAAAAAGASSSLPAGSSAAGGSGSSASLLANFLLRNARQQRRLLPAGDPKSLSVPGLELGSSAAASGKPASGPSLHLSIPPLSSSPEAPPALSAGSSFESASGDQDLAPLTGESPSATSKLAHPARLSGPYNTAGAAYVSSQYGLNPASLRIAAARGAVTPMLSASSNRLLHGGSDGDAGVSSSFSLTTAKTETQQLAPVPASPAVVPATPAKGSYVPPHKRAEMLRAEAAAKEAAAAAAAATAGGETLAAAPAADATALGATPAAEAPAPVPAAASSGPLSLPSLNIPSIARSASFREQSSGGGITTPASSPVSGGSVTGSAFTVTGSGTGSSILSAGVGFKSASRSTSTEASGSGGGAAGALQGMSSSIARVSSYETTDASALPPGSPQPRASLLSMLSVSRQSSTTASLPSPAASLTPAFGSTASTVTTPGSMTGTAVESGGAAMPGLLALGSAQSAFVQQAAAVDVTAGGIPAQLPALQPVAPASAPAPAPAPAAGGAWRSPRLAARLAAETTTASPAGGAAASAPAPAPAPVDPLPASQRPRPSSFDSVNGELSSAGGGGAGAGDASRPPSRSSVSGGWTTPGGGSGSSATSRAETLAASLLSEPPSRGAAAAAAEAASRGTSNLTGGGAPSFGAAPREEPLRAHYDDEDEEGGDDDYDDDDDTYRKLKTAKRVELVPIDHGLCLPSINGLDDISCSWVHWRQTKQPLSPSLKDYVLSLDGRADALLLRAALGDRIRPACLLTLRICTALLQEGVRAGLTLEEVGKMMLRGSGVGWLPPHHPSITGAGEDGDGGGSDGASGSAPAAGGLRARRDGLAAADGSLLYETTSHWHNQRSGHHSHPGSSRKGAASSSGAGGSSSGRRGPGEPDADAGAGGAGSGAGEEEWSALEQAVRRARKAAAKERRHILARAKAEAHNAQVLAAASAAAAAAASGSGPRSSKRAVAAAEAAAAAAAAAAKAAASAAAALSDLGDAGVEILQQVWGQSANVLGLPGSAAAPAGGAGGSGTLAAAGAASKQAPWNVTRAGKIHKKEEKRRKRVEMQRNLLAVAMEVQSQMQGGGGEGGEGGSSYDGSGNGSSSGTGNGTTVNGRTVFKKGIPSTATFGALPHPYVSPTSGSMSSPSLGPAAVVPAMADPFSLDGEGSSSTVAAGTNGGAASSPKATSAPAPAGASAAATSPASPDASLPAYIAYHDLIVKNFVAAVKPHIQAVIRNRKQTH